MKKAALFVHGLGGGKGTWGNFETLIKDDKEIEYEPFFYEYPSAIARVLPFVQKKFGNIQSLSNGLKTYIKHKLDDYDEIALVGHSLGGLVIRQYLLNQKISSRKTKVKKIIFYAVPQEGAGLANISTLISFNHRHLRQLCKNSEFLDTLNDQWGSSNIANGFEFQIILAVEDGTVSPQSAKSNFRNTEIEQIPNADHRSIVKPQDKNSLSFLILKKTLKKNISIVKDKIIGSLTYEEWNSRDGITIEFYPDNERKKIISNLQKELVKPKSTIRMIGLSGLGKTRLSIEACKKIPYKEQQFILYIDVATESHGLIQSANKWVSEEFTGILIVDNCPVDIHSQLINIIKRPESKLSLLTLDTDLKTSGNCPLIKLTKLDDNMIEKMLSDSYGKSLPDIDRIVTFAQGFPQMAVLIAKARINNKTDLGRLSDDHIADKLLWGTSQESIEDEKILRSCALFDRFGLDKEVSGEYKYIAKNISKIDSGIFFECIKRFEERGILDKRGRYIQLVPKPLAIRLAAQWWTRTETEEQKELLINLPDSLIESFCEQIEKLDFLPEVKEFTAKLCGVNSPFGQAEVILSIKGSRFFRAFVNVNPEATSAVLHRIITSLSIDEIASIDDARRNIVFSLEKLCFHANLFEESASSLLLLAMTESESWANNSTHTFTNFFQINLSGTEAEPTIKFNVLKNAMSLNDQIADSVILKALGTAITSYGHSSRMSGAEHQGTKAPLKDWEPKFWQDIFDYWQEAINLLLIMLERGEPQKEEAISIIGNSISHLILYDRTSMLDVAVKKVIEINGEYWPSALNSISNIYNYQTDKISPNGKKHLEKWKNSLNPDNSDFNTKLHVFVINPPTDFIDKDGHYVDLTIDRAKKFAIEVANNLDKFWVLLPFLFENEQRQGYNFGEQLIQSTDNHDILIEKVLSTLRITTSPNLRFCLGLFNGLYKKSEDSWLSCLESIKNDDDLSIYYPDFITTGAINKIHLENLLDLIINNTLPTTSASSLAYGGVIHDISSKLISYFCLSIYKINNEGAWTALAIMNAYCFHDREHFKEIKLAIKNIITNISFKSIRTTNMEMYQWNDFAEKLLDVDGEEFANSICKSLIREANNGFGYDDLWHYLQPLLVKTIKRHPNLWGLFGNAITVSKGKQTYWLLQLIGANNFSSNKSESVLSIIPPKKIIQWCHENKETKAFFIGKMINIFETIDGDKKPTPLFIAILENFGDDKRFASELSANLGTGSWVGSRIPYLESDKTAFQTLLNHSNRKVQAWITKEIAYIDEQIKYERMKEEEHQLGIY